MTRNTRVNLSRQSRFHNTNNFIPTGMLMMDERLHSNLTPDHWGMTTSLHKRRKLGVWNCRKGPFILKKPWCCHWNGICILMTLWRQMKYMVPLPFCFLKTPPFTSHFCTHLRVSSLVSFIAAVHNSGSFFQRNVCPFFKGIKLLFVLPQIIGTEAKCPRRPIATEFTYYMYMF